MRQRCSNPRNTHYGTYGARGITVCEEWEKFEAFRDWALANGYEASLEIDRIDNDAGYSPSNCRFVTKAENSRDRTTTRNFDFFGENLCLSEAARRFGIGMTTLRYRICRAGYSPEQAVTMAKVVGRPGTATR